MVLFTCKNPMCLAFHELTDEALDNPPKYIQCPSCGAIQPNPFYGDIN